MSSFIRSSACNGHGPDGLVALRHHPRPDLIARLLRERRVARFIIAPGGFGKTSLCYEYADTIFGFQHVFWINGKSPCFLRDVDDGSIFAAIRAVDEARCLVVFEDVPRMDGDRCAAFSQLLDNLLEGGNEVLITCTPSCDAYAGLQRDRILLRAKDLFLSDDEVVINLIGERDPDKTISTIPLAERVACYRWGDQGETQLLAGLKGEDLPADLLITILSFCLLEYGALDDVKAVIPTLWKEETINMLATEYPYLGIDLEEGLFHCARVSVDALAAMFATKLEALATAASIRRDDFASACANRLIGHRSHDRAVQVVTAFATKAGWSSWLARCGWHLLTVGALKPVVMMHSAIVLGKRKKQAAVDVVAAWAYELLGDEAAAVRLVRRVSATSDADRRDRALAAVAVMVHCEGDRLRMVQAMAQEAVTPLAKAGVPSTQAQGPTTEPLFSLPDSQQNALNPTVERHPQGQDSSTFMNQFVDWQSLTSIALAIAESPQRGLELWCRKLAEYEQLNGNRPAALDSPEPTIGHSMGEESALQAEVALDHALHQDHSEALRRSLAISAGWILTLARTRGLDLRASEAISRIEHQGGDATHVLDRDLISRLAAFVVRTVDHLVERNDPAAWFEMRAGSQLLLAAQENPLLKPFKIGPKGSAVVSHADYDLQLQREAYRHDSLKKDQQRDDYYHTHPNEFRNDLRRPRAVSAITKAAPPTLHVNLFGGIEVRIGSMIVTSGFLKRQRTRILLALLVLHHGRDISRERISKILWPEKQPEAARKNFYSLWSQLKHALTVDGTCPYLIRTQFGCRIDMRLVDSDVTAFESLCRQLLFKKDQPMEWERLYALVTEQFADELMPYETENEEIICIRDRYHTQLMDALVAASTHLLEMGENRGALWFAREALRRDRTREDIYLALMKAQIASGQRAAALQTYFACRDYMTEELGIDPSQAIVDLYRSIIEEEVDV